jgi:hypothetical protein
MTLRESFKEALLHGQSAERILCTISGNKAWRRALWSDEVIVLEKIASSTLLKKTHMLR